MAWHVAWQFRRSAGAICRSETNKFNTQMNRSDLIWTLMSKKPAAVYNAVKGCDEMYKEDLALVKEN